ncbi:hypothetical protein M405DRAFT_813051 [Rhizopogon salebrosus TDB-379]|nr:hypothetical protein M405DRAFT_813051 [Rhizopogon salebrosus TDB-379]
MVEESFQPSLQGLQNLIQVTIAILCLSSSLAYTQDSNVNSRLGCDDPGFEVAIAFTVGWPLALHCLLLLVAACVGCYRSLVHFRQQYMTRRNTKADSVDLEV